MYIKKAGKKKTKAKIFNKRKKTHNKKGSFRKKTTRRKKNKKRFSRKRNLRGGGGDEFLQVYCEKGTYNPEECRDPSYPCVYNDSCMNSKGKTLMDEMTLKNEAEKAFLRRIGVGKVRDKIDLVKRDKLMEPRINELSNLMSKSKELADIQDFIDAKGELTPLLVRRGVGTAREVLNTYIKDNENDKVKKVYTLFPEMLRDLRTFSIESWPLEYMQAWDKRLRDEVWFYGRFSMAVAAKYGNFEIVKFLVENGVNSQDVIYYALNHYHEYYVLGTPGWDPGPTHPDIPEDPAVMEKYKNLIIYLAKLEGIDIKYDEKEKVFTGDDGKRSRIYFGLLEV